MIIETLLYITPVGKDLIQNMYFLIFSEVYVFKGRKKFAKP